MHCNSCMHGRQDVTYFNSTGSYCFAEELLMTEPEGKPKRLRAWLEGRLNRGDIPGMRWLDEDKTMFRITWKHHGKQDWSAEDGRPFMVSILKRYWHVHTLDLCSRTQCCHSIIGVWIWTLEYAFCLYPHVRHTPNYINYIIWSLIKCHIYRKLLKCEKLVKDESKL